MNRYSINVSSNCSHIGGCSLTQCVQELAADPDIFIRPDINKLVDEEKSVLLSRNPSSDHCEFYIHKFPDYKIQAISFVCNVAKVEIFQDRIMEYVETVYGVVVDETDDQFKSYRYDVEIEKSGVTDLTLRFLTNSSEVCIFGFILHTSPNPNGITSLLPSGSILNAPNTSQTESKLNTLPELLEHKVSATQHNSSMLDQQLKEKFKIANGEEPSRINKKINEDLLESLKKHIDKRFEEIVLHVNNKLTEMEERQNKKLDKLLQMLENK